MCCVLIGDSRHSAVHHLNLFFYDLPLLPELSEQWAHEWREVEVSVFQNQRHLLP
jgi:hypothetical protein